MNFANRSLAFLVFVASLSADRSRLVIPVRFPRGRPFPLTRRQMRLGHFHSLWTQIQPFSASCRVTTSVHPLRDLRTL